MIFVDTGGWFASAVPSDRDYARATAWLGANTEPLVTSDYVLDEVLTLLRARGHADLALAMGQDLFDHRTATLYYLDELDVRRAWETFSRYSDKDWSFTDCASKVVMERLGITTAFAFDQHFRQFGSVRVVP